MNARSGTERILDAYLAPEADRLPDRVIEAALDQVARTPQRRALRVPWRFPTMPAVSRATGIAAVALVAVVGAGSVVYLNSSPSSGGVSQATATPPPPTAAPTTEPSVAPTPGCSEVARGICGWKTYTSTVYGYTISYPDDWSVVDRATEKWQPGESEDAPYADVFFNNAPENGQNDEQMIFAAFQIPAPAGADVESWDGLLAAMTDVCAELAAVPNSDCSNGDVVTPMCLGTPGCHPVAFVQHNGFPRALFGDPESGRLTYVVVHRVDKFPGAARYGGTVMLLKSVLSQLGVREPGPGETPN